MNPPSLALLCLSTPSINVRENPAQTPSEILTRFHVSIGLSSSALRPPKCLFFPVVTRRSKTSVCKFDTFSACPFGGVHLCYTHLIFCFFPFGHLAVQPPVGIVASFGADGSISSRAGSSSTNTNHHEPPPTPLQEYDMRRSSPESARILHTLKGTGTGQQVHLKPKRSKGHELH